MKTGRNAPCPCGSGKKYKKCCMPKDASNVVDGTEFIWRKLRQTEADLVAILLEYAIERFDDETIHIAWDEFWMADAFEIDVNALPDMDPVFALWLIFTWDLWDVLDDTDIEKEFPDAAYPTIALFYLEECRKQLDLFQCRYIKEITSRPYSFHQVIDVDPGKSLTLRDLLLNQSHVVIENQASREDIKGSILFARVISLDGVFVMTGCIGFPIPAQYQASFIDFRNNLEKEEGAPLTADILLEIDFELRERFFEIFDYFQNQPLPELQNTDGEPLVPVKLMYHLNCSPTEAFECLKSLADGADDEELLMDAVHDQQGVLMAIHFPWLKKGNEKKPGWENTVMGTIEINKNRLTVEVNSLNRSKIIKKEIKKRLGKHAVYKKSVISSIQKTMEKGMGTGPDAKIRDQSMSHDDLMQLPEVKAKITKMAKSHWDSWIDIPVPALGNLTPKEAAKDPVGREKLEGLFLHFESMNRKQGQNNFSPDIARLKQILGL